MPVSATAAAPAAIQFSRFSSATDFGAGAFDTTTLDGDHLVLASGATDGTWTSQSVQPLADFTRLVASWNADTPAAASMTVQVQVTTSAGENSGWYTPGIWAAGDTSARRTSVSGQNDALGRVATDTLSASGDAFASYALRTP
jgi:hypothetical protein